MKSINSCPLLQNKCFVFQCLIFSCVLIIFCCYRYWRAVDSPEHTLAQTIFLANLIFCQFECLDVLLLFQLANTINMSALSTPLGRTKI